MKRKKRLKIRRNIIIITALLLILFGVMLIREKIHKDPSPATEDHDDNVENEPVEEEETQFETGSGNEEEPEEEPWAEEPVEEAPEQGVVIENPEKTDVLVNRKRNLPESYVPEDLVTLSDVPTVLSNPEVNQMRSNAYDALKELFKAAQEEEGYELLARSGYRSYYTQASLYSSYVENNGQAAADKFSAKPGQSEHQTGLAMDITCEAVNYRLDESFGETEEGKWVAANSHRFGYIIRYPKEKEDITGYMYEPWHIRYLGTELAEKVYDSGLTLEEYFQ